MSKEFTNELTAPDTPDTDTAASPTDAPDPRRPADGPQAERSPEELQRCLAEALAKCDEHVEALLRARAETDNVRKRGERELSNARKYALERFVQELLPVKDSMEMGLAAAGEAGADLEKLREGAALTLRMFTAAAEKFGVSEVDPLGQAFDPERHQAISAVDSEQAESGTVINVVQKGYMLQDRLVRPALVIVAR